MSRDRLEVVVCVTESLVSDLRQQIVMFASKTQNIIDDARAHFDSSECHIVCRESYNTFLPYQLNFLLLKILNHSVNQRSSNLEQKMDSSSLLMTVHVLN